MLHAPKIRKSSFKVPKSSDLTTQGKQVVSILVSEYHMTERDALKLARDAGQWLLYAFYQR